MQETTPTETDAIPLDWFRFDVCGKLIEWVVPPFKADAHNASTVASTPEPHPHYDAAVIEQDLKKLICYIQRGIVSNVVWLTIITKINNYSRNTCTLYMYMYSVITKTKTKCTSLLKQH